MYGYSRQNYYKRKKVEIKIRKEQEVILGQVRHIRQRQPNVGGRKLHKMIDVTVGRDKLFDLLRENGLLVKRKKKYNNLIKDKEPTGPEQQYVSDITYIDTREGFRYLSLITDRYSRKIVGHELSRSLSVEGSLKALQMAIKTVADPERLIHHSDRGLQYCSNAYIELLKKHKIKISMTEENHVYENAMAERVNGILKQEFLLGEKIHSYYLAKKMVKEAVHIYNEERLHMSIGYVTPQQKHLNFN